jgi:hypothetical protein
MKDSAATHEAKPEDDSSPLERFAKVMRALVAVPKGEVDEKLAKEKIAPPKRGR